MFLVLALGGREELTGIVRSRAEVILKTKWTFCGEGV